MVFKVFRQEIFQGRMHQCRYFEGWYFKHVSYDLEHVYSFIPGVSLSGRNPHSFIQVMDGISGESKYIQYDLKEFSWDKKSMYVKVGDSYFTDSGIHLDIMDGDRHISGTIHYKSVVKYPKSLFSPGIMGWYSFVPFMECKHAIVSIYHMLHGGIHIDGHDIDFTGGTGYIEKDWGTSFPKEWIWLHCNTFKNSMASLTVSIAKIPWLGRYFIGFIGFLHTGKRTYIFATYNGSTVKKLLRNGSIISISIKNADYYLDIIAEMKREGSLMAPVKGDMMRMIKESVDSEVTVKLSDKNGGMIFNDTGRRAGLEVMERIFEYFN